MFLAENMSEEADRENRVAILSPDDIIGDLPQPRQQEITIDHRTHMSIDELLKIIKGANGMPVLFVPSNDGRLAALAVDGIQNLVPTNHGHKGCNCTSREDKNDFRAWLLLLASLIATVTFTAGITPPGGFWAADDKANGYVAGTSVLRDKFHVRYAVFYYSNTTAFLTSMVVIGMLAKNKEITVRNSRILGSFVVLSFSSLGTTYIAGTRTSVKFSRLTYVVIVLFLAIVGYMLLDWLILPIFKKARVISLLKK
jgi:hypothetical protein